MVYTEKTETWACCDKCSFTEFAGFNASAAEVRGMRREGWTFGKKVLCPYCSEEAGLIKPQENWFSGRAS